jgi:RimJ/RimL family protein N-acetyltransferase
VSERLETARLVLRPAQTDDLSAYGTWGPDPERELRRGVESWQRHGFGHWTLLRKEPGDVIGVVELGFAGEGLAGMSPDEHEIGWSVTPERRGQGFATEAATAVAEDTFERIRPPWLLAYIRLDNAASIRVAEKLGMSDEGEGRSRGGNAVRIYRLRSAPRP